MFIWVKLNLSVMCTSGYVIAESVVFYLFVTKLCRTIALQVLSAPKHLSHQPLPDKELCSIFSFHPGTDLRQSRASKLATFHFYDG